MESKRLLVTGDLALDTNIYKGIRKSPEINKYGTLIKKINGGSHLLSEIISKTILKSAPLKLAELTSLIQKKEEEIEKEKSEEKSNKLENLENGLNWLNEVKRNWENAICNYGLKEEIFTSDNLPSSLKTYAAWGLKETVVPKPFQKTCGEKTKAWKVTEMMGWGKDTEESPVEYHKWILQQDLYPDILVFDDGGNIFRNDEKAWSDLLYETSEDKEQKARNIAQVILKTAYPLGHGNLFRKLTKDFSKKLTIITSINEIRKEDVLISKGVSWEQTALDLVSELKHNKSINKLLNCKRLIVNFQSEGAMYIEMDDKEEILK